MEAFWDLKMSSFVPKGNFLPAIITWIFRYVMQSVLLHPIVVTTIFFIFQCMLTGEADMSISGKEFIYPKGREITKDLRGTTN